MDLRPLARAELALDVADRVGLAAAEEVPTTLEDLLESLGIEYWARGDVRSTSEPAESVDVITSSNTLEHIPRGDIELILRECHRILVADGILSFQIDYKDHYSYFDPTCSPYRFLSFTSARWRLYNPALHHQNRLRHRDYLELFEGPDSR